MTEEDAKTKWCPFARVITVHASEGMIIGPANRTEVCGEDHFTKPMGSFCIGSACMAWRWKDAPVATRRLNPDKPAPFDKAGDGFCGLAGSPTP